MNESTEIDVLAASDYGEKYDAACKRLFGNKEILAPILKYTVREYRDSSIQDIIRYIDKESISDVDPVGDVPIRVEGMNTEMSSISEKLVMFDKHFKAAVPGGDGTLDCVIHFDFEIQNNYRPSAPSYPMPKRAVYYVARELCAQLLAVTKETDYSSLRKCYSIWICNDRIPKDLQNTVTSYRMGKENIVGNAGFDPDYDLMEVVMILRGEESNSSPILDYLQVIFSSNLDTIEKHVDVGSNKEIISEVKEMSGIGATIARKNLEKGRQEGRQEGQVIVFKNKIRRGFSVKEAMGIAEITEEQAGKALEELGVKNS